MDWILDPLNTKPKNENPPVFFYIKTDLEDDYDQKMWSCNLAYLWCGVARRLGYIDEWGMDWRDKMA